VPGDPLDKSIKIKPLEPATPSQAARDFVLKTRRRKGLREDVGVAAYLEADIVRSLREEGVLDG
jgi:U5 small nuclear ribonucleoprotein component